MYHVEKKRKDSKNLYYYISLKLPNGQRFHVRKSAGTTNHVEAEAIAAAEHEKLLKQKIYKEKRELTLDEALGKYLTEYSAFLKSKVTDYYFSLNLVKGINKTILLSDINDEIVNQYILFRKKTVSNRTINKEIKHLSKVLKRAREYWDSNAFNLVIKKHKLPEKGDRIRALNQEELNRLIDCSPSYLKPIIITAVCTGLRKSNVLSLKTEQIDWRSKSITVMAKSSLEDGKRHTVQMTPQLETILKELAEKSTDGYLFHFKGKPIRSVKRSFNTACKRAGIQDFHFHDLRHTTATMVYGATRDIRIVKEILGHSRIDQTMKYAHFFQDQEREALEKTFNKSFNFVQNFT